MEHRQTIGKGNGMKNCRKKDQNIFKQKYMMQKNNNNHNIYSLNTLSEYLLPFIDIDLFVKS
jgi:hypothetical protein